MKKTLLLLLTIISLQSIAQDKQSNNTLILISAQGKTVDAFLDSNNSNKILTLTTKKDKEARLVFAYVNAKNESTYNRSYILANDKDEDLQIGVVGRTIGTNYASLDEVFSKTQKGKTYKLYTVAIPKDPNVAATVRVRRILLCNIAVK